MAYDILIVDDEADIRTLLSGTLEDEGYQTREAHDADSALDAIQARIPNLLILDIWLMGSRLDGLELLEQVKRDCPNLQVLMISGHGNIETAVSSIKKGAYDFIEKPFRTDRLLLMVVRAIEAGQLKMEVEALRQRAGQDDDMIGTSSAIQQLRGAIDKVAPTGSRVLITGPPGSGKEMVARLLHENSRRSDGPFTVLNCATMHPEHMEIELFGREPGANGGEGPRKVGTFEQAHGGTLFLDEVVDMPIETQGKIVRVLQEQTFSRVGGSALVQVDVRVIASSTHNLADEMAAGGFRQDLYYRLNVVPIGVPALRERTEDVPLLIEYFMGRGAENSGLPAREVGVDAMVALQSYEWPGNVRQLKNVVDWLLIMAPGGVDDPIKADMLPPEIGAITPQVLKWDKGGEIMGLSLRGARELFEREYLMAQVNRFGGNISRTASFVGMERSALHRKLKSLGVQGAEKQKAGS